MLLGELLGEAVKVMLQGLCPAAVFVDEALHGAIDHEGHRAHLEGVLRLLLEAVYRVALLEDLHTLEAHDGQQHQHDHDEDAGYQTIHRLKLA
jgi:hypothetical protein